MNILIVSAYYPPFNSIASQRPLSWAKHWAADGHAVTVLTLDWPTLPDQSDSDETGVRVIRKRLPTAMRKALEGRHRPGALSEQPDRLALRLKQRALRTLSGAVAKLKERYGILSDGRMPSYFDFWAFADLRDLPAVPWDVIVSTYAPYSAHLLGLRLKSKFPSAVWIADYRDLWTANHFYSGVWPFVMLERAIESRIAARANILTTVSAPLVEQLRQTYPKANVKCIYNGFESSDYATGANATGRRGQLRKIVYTGTYYDIQDPGTLLLAIKQLKDSGRVNLLDRLQVQFVGLRCDRIEPLIVKYGVGKWVSATPQLSRQAALELQQDADVLLFMGYERSGSIGVMSGKIFEYLNSGVPIWAFDVSEDSEVGALIRLSPESRLFPPEVDTVAEALHQMLESTAPRSRSDVRPHIQKYERRVLARQLLEQAVAVRNNAVFK